MDDLYKKGDEFVSSSRAYTVVSIINSTRYSEVYRIRRNSDKKTFLMKVLKTEKMPDTMIHEGVPRIMRLLDTSNIAQQLSVFDWGPIDSDHYYIISRYFTKGLLSDRLRDGSLKLNTAVNLVLDLAKTLSSLQAYDSKNNKTRQLRHGDVCSNNIMYDFDEKGDYKAYLIDIEHLSYIADDLHDSALCSDIMYIDHQSCAPEVFENEAAYNSDVFSLGIVLYECCFGEHPFPDLTPDNIEYPKPYYTTQTKCGGVAGLINKLLKGMLEVDPTKRLDMAAVISQLNVIRQVTKIHNVELSDEACFDNAIIKDYKSILEKHNQTFTLHEDRVFPDFKYDFIYYTENDRHKVLEYITSELEFIEPDFPSKQTEEENINLELNYSSLIRSPKKGAKGFNDVAGMAELKEKMTKKVLYFLRNPELAQEYKINYPNGMLLYGPPGCGKTFFAEKFAEESGFSFGLIKASDLGSTWVHGTQGKINQLFKEAKSKAPCVLCFDEFDAFAPDRASLSHSANLSGEVNEFLSQLNNIGNEKIFIIATTNNPEGIDPAVLRSGRIEHKFYIPAPDFEARKAVIKLATLNRPCAEGIDFDHLAKLTEGYVTSDLSLIVNDAAMNAAYARKFITQSMIEEAISNYRPSVSKEVINEHEEIRKRIESDTTTRNRIGFK